MMILLVEDDEPSRTAISTILEGVGYDVVATDDPHEALGSPDTPAVLITDVDLGSTINGFDVAQNAHRLWPEVRVIVISALEENHSEHLDTRDRYIEKPFSGRLLLRAVDEVANSA